MTYREVMEKLESLGDEKTREDNRRRGVDIPQFGVKMGALREVAKKIKSDHELGLELWKSGQYEAMLLAALIMKPKQLSDEELDQMLSQVTYFQVADWFVTNVIKQHPRKEAHRERWMNSDNVMTARTGWSLTAERIAKSPDGLDLAGLLDRIEVGMAAAPSASRDLNRVFGTVEWTMNFCLAEIGINFPEYRDRAIAIGEKLGAFKDYPVSKGCTSPYAPIWIAEMVKRAG